MKKALMLTAFVMTLLCATHAQALTPTATWGLGGGNPYWNDYDIYLGVYAPNTTTSVWSQRLAYSHNSSDGNPSGGIEDISAASSYLEGHRWYLLVDDNWGYNSSYIQTFQVTTGAGTFGAAGLPIYVPDNAARYAYVDLPESGPSTVPEPATMALFTLGSTGLAFIRKRKV